MTTVHGYDVDPDLAKGIASPSDAYVANLQQISRDRLRLMREIGEADAAADAFSPGLAGNRLGMSILVAWFALCLGAGVLGGLWWFGWIS